MQLLVGFRVLAQRDETVGQGEPQLAFGAGLSLQFAAVQPLHSLVDQLPRGGIGPDAFVRIDAAEHVDEVVVHQVGALRLQAGFARLPQRGAEAGTQRDHHRGGGTDRQCIAADETTCAVTQGRRAGRDRLGVQPGQQVRAQRIHAAVALGGIGHQAALRDRRKVAAQLFCERAGCRAALRRIFCGGVQRCVPQRLRIAIHPRQPRAQWGFTGQAIGMRLRQQRVQQHAELVEIGGGRDRLAMQLFGRCVFGGERTLAGTRVAGVVVLHQLGDAEVQQERVATGIDHDVRWLQVAMHHQLPMRERHRIQHLQQQAHPAAHVQRACIAPAIDAFALHPRHHEPRRVVFVHAAVEQAGDVRMLQAGQDLPLAQEALARQRTVQADADALERGFMAVRAVDALDPIDRAHAAAAQHLPDVPRADAGARRQFRGIDAVLAQSGELRGDRVGVFAGIGGEHRLHIAMQLDIIAAFLGQPRRARGRGQLQRGIEQLQGALQARRVDAHALPSWAIRNARARRQSRCTVRSVMPWMSAISGSV